MERRIDFRRGRHMLCTGCGHRFFADLDWIDRWGQSGEECPGCGLTCEHEDAPRVTVDHDDPALDDERVAQFSWYHTSTHPDWPLRDFDPAADLTSVTRKRMGGDRRVAEWAARQQAKALHVGTYEAAVHNMLRRMRDQADRGSQFHLYRVHLKPSVVVRDGWLIDPNNWLGDVVLDEVCPSGVDVARYLNYHEDPGGLSLALGRDAVAGVQQVAVPLPDAGDDEWVRGAVLALEEASDFPAPATGKLAGSGGRFRRGPTWAESSRRLWATSCRSTSGTSSSRPQHSPRETTQGCGHAGPAASSSSSIIPVACWQNLTDKSSGRCDSRWRYYPRRCGRPSAANARSTHEFDGNSVGGPGHTVIAQVVGLQGREHSHEQEGHRDLPRGWPVEEL